MTPYSAGYEFPRDLHDDGPRSYTEGLWEPGSSASLARGCLCTNRSSFPLLGHLLATNCPVHVVAVVAVRLSQGGECRACGNDPEGCGCVGNEREGKV